MPVRKRIECRWGACWPAAVLVGLGLGLPAGAARAQSGAATANANAGAGGTPGAAAAAGAPVGAARAPAGVSPGGPAVAPRAPATTPAPTAPTAPAPGTLPPSAAAGGRGAGPGEGLPPAPTTPDLAAGHGGPPAVATPADPALGPPSATPAEVFAVPDPPRPRNFLAVARESIFGPADYAPWTPLPFRTFFSEGWRDPWIAPPNGSGDARRQGWIGAADGNFYRLYWISYIEAFNTNGAPNGYTSRINIYTPLSRRLLLITTIPTVNANTPSFNLGTADFGSSGAAINGVAQGTGTSFGDLTLTPRFMLKETRDLSLSAQLTVQIPTGRTGSGAGKAILSPAIQFWRDIGHGRAIRGAVNAGTGTNGPGRGETIVSQLAYGRTITPHDVPIFGDFTYYLAANVSNQVAPTALTTVTLGPGYRTHLGNDWYSLGAVTIPVTGPHPYDESMTLWLMKTF